MLETDKIISIEQAMAALGITDNSLSRQQRKTLDEQGFLLMPSVLDRAWLAELRTAFDRLAGEAGIDGSQESGTRHIGGLLEQGPAFERMFVLPQLLAAVYAVLGQDFRMTEIDGRDPQPGFGQQGLHTDWLERRHYDPFYVVNSIWMLDDFTPDNGPTRIVPGSHRLQIRPSKAALNPNVTYPGQQLVTGLAGSLLIFNGHLLHSGTLNRSQQGRRSLRCEFLAAGQSQGNYHKQPPSPALLARLSPAARYLIEIGTN